MHLPCQACEVIYWPTMKWSEHQRSRRTSNNPCQLISIKGQGQGSGFAQKAAAIGTWKPKWIRTLDLRVGKCSRLLLFNPFCFEAGRWQFGHPVCDFQNVLISMALGWWKHGDSNIFPYEKPVLNPYLENLIKTMQKPSLLNLARRLP